MESGKFQVLFARNVEEALHFARTVPEIRFGLIDVGLEDYAPYSAEETGNSMRAGIRLLQDLEDLLPSARFILTTASFNADELRRRVENRPSLVFPHVISGQIETDLIESRAAGAYAGGVFHPWILIVHGHDVNGIGALKGVLLSEFDLKDVHILKDLPNRGRTIIEKFEHYARRADIVFAMMTDDDPGQDDQMRARQNVIFEIGYFCSALQRTSGRLILLKTNRIEIPSDMNGLVAVNISGGINTADVIADIASELRSIGIARLSR